MPYPPSSQPGSIPYNIRPPANQPIIQGGYSDPSMFPGSVPMPMPSNIPSNPYPTATVSSNPMAWTNPRPTPYYQPIPASVFSGNQQPQMTFSTPQVPIRSPGYSMCLQGHPLYESNSKEGYPTGIYVCANCRNSFYCEANSRFCCLICKYDLCKACKTY